MKNLYKLILLIVTITVIPACKNTSKQPDNSQQTVNVKVTRIRQVDIIKYAEYYGNTEYLNKNRLTAPVTGYITENKLFFGKKVHQNDLLFKLETREQKALENSSPAKHIEVRSNADGYISELKFNNTDDFVSEGEMLCVVTEDSQPVIRVNVPFEKAGKIKKDDNCEIILADQSIISGNVYRIIPMIEGQNQTQEIMIKPQTNRTLPENLNVTIRFIDVQHKAATVLPKQAVMTNETQSEFWVMKVSGSTAFKIPVNKGIETDSLIEITEPEFNDTDLIITEGSYELPDSSSVHITK
ncbi:efflux RND transporter periplasmic adaptor subunit [Saccharicrinis sp. FJH2]|uniref:efflux RND transporter periplasmic adaptor subunit n=1 Tax=Saccharicrinis sp. FJH65 TaxID=3344659 RepID=UPI0035F23E4C